MQAPSMKHLVAKYRPKRFKNRRELKMSIVGSVSISVIFTTIISKFPAVMFSVIPPPTSSVDTPVQDFRMIRTGVLQKKKSTEFNKLV